jgi:peptidoglycan/xylan/chitin deacetylase (PgdA/CDA1 family)
MFKAARVGRNRSASARTGPEPFEHRTGLAAGVFLAIASLALPSAAVEDVGRTPILAYHRFDPTVAGATTVTVAAFEDQLAWLAKHNYRIVSLRTALAELNGTEPRRQTPATVITVDDGHKSIYSVLFPLIRKAHVPVTLFVYPSAISNAPYALTWAELQEMQASGLVDVESHTYWHPNFKIEHRRRTGADYATFVDSQLSRSKAVIKMKLGKPVDLLAWPFGIVDADLEAAAKRAGYTAAFAYAGGPAAPGDDLLSLPRIPVSDADRGERFGALLKARGPKKREP